MRNWARIFKASSQRNYQLFLYISTTILVKGLSMFTLLISTPLTYKYLDKEEFGILATLTSILGLMSFSDLGLGFGLQNAFSKFDSNINDVEKKNYISTTWNLLLSISITLSLIITSAYLIWANKDDEPIDLLWIYGFNFLIIFLIGLPFSIIQKIQIGSNRGHINQIWNATSNIISLILLLLFTSLKLSPTWIIFALFGTPAAIQIIAFLNDFYLIRKYPKPKLWLIHRKTANNLLRIGGIFLITQLSTALLMASNNLIITYYNGNEAVSDFSVAIRFSIFLSAPIALLAPTILPSLNDAFNKNDLTWIKLTLMKTMKILTAYSILISLTTLIWGKLIIKFWIGNNIPIFDSNIYTFVFFTIYLTWNSLISYIMLSNRFIGNLYKIYPIAVIITLVIKLIILKHFENQSLILVEITTMSLLFFIPSFFIIKKEIQST